MVPLPDGDCQMEVRTGGGNSVVYWAAEHTGQSSFVKNNSFENLNIIMAGENGAKGNIIVADMDGDQEVEILGSSELGSTTLQRGMPLYGSEALSASEPASFPRFVLTPNPQGWSDPIRSTAAVGDVDKDGKVDLLVAAGGQLYLWNLNKPFTPALSLWPMFQHDLRNTGVASSSHWQPDLYLQDTPADLGFEPNTVSSLLFISSDIWIRTSADTVAGSTNPGPDTTLPADRYYANEHQHQNPIYVDQNTPGYIYVKVRNRGCSPGAGTEKLRVYWADASTGLPSPVPWPGPGIWNELDCVPGPGVDPCSLPVIAPGQDYVVQLPWVPPNPTIVGVNGHFCLVARIETQPSGTFGMTFSEGTTLWSNVANNNNIVWKNVTVIDGSGGGKVNVVNPLDHAVALGLHFAVPPEEMRNNLLMHGDVYVDLGDALMKKWRQGGGRPRGFAVVGKTTIKITDPTGAQLDGLLFNRGEKHTLQIRVQLKPGDRAAPGSRFNWDVIEVAPLTRKARPGAIGGERYTLIVPAAAR